MRFAAFIAIVCIILWVGMTVAQIWGYVISPELYWKITATLTLVGGGIVALAMIIREYSSDKKLKKDKFID